MRTLALAILLSLGLPGLWAQDTGKITFVQVSDTHWGFANPKINPDATGTLPRAIDEINRLKVRPDFLVFTGDETHTTGDDAVRQKRMIEFKAMVAKLNVKTIHFLPGEHDVNQDDGMAYQSFFGDLHYTFDYRGVHFVALDNVSSPDASLGEAQLNWLAGLLKSWDKNSQVVLFAHRPLVDVWAQWDWRTKDGAKALALLQSFPNVSLFYGHIHQKRTDAQVGFTQYAAKGMMFPLPAPGSMATPAQVPWDPSQPYRGLGFRVVTIEVPTKKVSVQEYGLVAAAGASDSDSDAYEDED